jgi:CO/xanthine dehydrogenase FAD-binding subunit
VGASQIQNRGTLGGNIVNASPAGDTLPVLAVFEAELEIGSARGLRKMPFNQFYSGYRQTRLAPEEMLLAIHLPKPAPGDWQYFRKVGTRQAQAISKVVMAILARRNQQQEVELIRIAYGSVAPTVIRAPQTEALLAHHTLSKELIERAKQNVVQEVHPISDVRSTEDYRRLISGNILSRALQEWQPAEA